MSYFIFLLALNYKQTKHNQSQFLYNILLIGVTVLGTFILLLLPWCSSIDDLKSVFIRVFPFQRGIYEDKSANIFSILSIIYKFHVHIPQYIMIRISTICTLSSLLYTQYCTVKQPTILNFIYNLIISSLSFYLFSYQVHEKTILFVLCPLLWLLPRYTVLSCYCMFICNFSMYPLLIRDGAFIPYAVSQFIILCIIYDQYDVTSTGIHDRYIYRCIQFSTAICILLHMIQVIIPIYYQSIITRYPDIITYGFTIFSGIHFVALLLYLYYEQHQYTNSLNQTNDHAKKIQ